MLLDNRQRNLYMADKVTITSIEFICTLTVIDKYHKHGVLTKPLYYYRQIVISISNTLSYKKFDLIERYNVRAK